jgi:hypothetical protein
MALRAAKSDEDAQNVEPLSLFLPWVFNGAATRQ